ncbi:MAG TPA: hypothetical protein DIS73_00115 [Planctomycetia bacterium]|nr:hypothetical protein [Planctomycetia bacterium]
MHLESGMEKSGMPTPRPNTVMETMRPVVSLGPTRYIKTKSLRILVVDDEKAICRFMNRFLSREGQVARTVDNGAEAIHMLKSEDFDLVLCDLAMPGVSGWDIIREIETLDKKPKVGIITAWGPTLNKLKHGDLRVDFVINKPIELVELTARINEVLGAEERPT